MISTPFFVLKALFLFIHRIFSKRFRRTATAAVHQKCQKHPSPGKLPGGGDGKVLIFNVEGALLKPSSPFFFSYFMLVAFEAGGLLRAAALLMSYPLIRLAGQEMGLKIMVMISFFGVKKESFRVGSSVLPKFFVNDVGSEAFEALKIGGKRIGFSNFFPQVMIESFLRDYLEVEEVVGRELKVFCGYFVGFMEEKVKLSSLSHLVHQEEEERNTYEKNGNLIGICGSQKGYDFQLLSSICNEIYSVSEADKNRWKTLPKDKLPKPLVFHDGRLALNPTPLDTLALFTWLPFALILVSIRIFAYIFLPYNLCVPVNAFTGMHLTVSIPIEKTKPNSNRGHNQGVLYVCNHRTLLDPLYISAALRINNPLAVTYSLSPVSEFLSPIRTVRLTRNHDQDATLMAKLLLDRNLIICPEGTTCREPYLLRFSPLFSEISEKIVPIANDTHVTMFYGTSASGFKCFDPLFFLMNPSPSYTIKKLDMVDGLLASQNDSNPTRFDVANCVQREIGKALEFECTKLTRRDKYMILAGNEGIVHSN